MIIQHNIRSVAFKHLFFQFGVVALLSVATTVLFSVHEGCSLLLGGLACILPSSYFSWRFSRYTGASNASLIMKDFYRGEVGKLLLTVLMFLLIFTFIPVTMFHFFTGFIMAHVAFWLSSLILRSERAVI